METKETQKPLILRMEEAEKETVAAVNNIMSKCDLPCYFYELVFDKIHRQLKDGAKGELDSAERQYRAEVEARAKADAEAKADAAPPEKEVK